MATLKRAICDKKWLAMLPFLPFVALTETTNGPFMSCLLGNFQAAKERILNILWINTNSKMLSEKSVSNNFFNPEDVNFCQYFDDEELINCK